MPTDISTGFAIIAIVCIASAALSPLLMWILPDRTRVEKA